LTPRKRRDSASSPDGGLLKVDRCNLFASVQPDILRPGIGVTVNIEEAKKPLAQAAVRRETGAAAAVIHAARLESERYPSNPHVIRCPSLGRKIPLDMGTTIARCLLAETLETVPLASQHRQKD